MIQQNVAFCLTNINTSRNIDDIDVFAQHQNVESRK